VDTRIDDDRGHRWVADLVQVASFSSRALLADCRHVGGTPGRWLASYWQAGHLL
jgi:hypothetical protein